MAGGVEYQVTKVDPTSPQTKGMVHQVHKVSEEIAATIGGKVYRARIINDPDDPSVKGMVYNAILTGGSEAVVVGPAVSPLELPDVIADTMEYVKAYGGTEQRNLPDNYIERQFTYMMDGSYLLTDIVPTYDCKVEMDFQTTTLPSASVYFFGGRTETYGGLFFARTVNAGFIVDAFGARHNSNVSVSNNTRYKFTYDNQVAKVESAGTTLFTNTFTGTGATGAAFCINGLNTSGTITTTNTGIYLYSFKVWNAQGELVADYVPAIQRGTVPVVGFYDTVSKTFKTATAGTFAAGGEAVPAPSAPMDIVSNNGVLKVSPNLFNKATVSKYTLLSTSTGDTISQSNEWSWCSDFIPVEPNTTYYFKSGANWNVRIFEYESDKSYTNTNYTVLNSSFTTGGTTAYIRFHIGAATGGQEMYDGETMISLGSSVLPYMLYGQIYTDGTIETIEDTIGNTATAEMLLKVGDYQDVQSIIDGVVTRNVGVKALDGTESWQLNNNRFRCSGLVPVADSNVMVCSHFAFTGNLTTDNTIYRAPDSNWLQIRYDTANNDVTTFTNFLAAQYAAGTPVIIVYALATEATESVTGQTLQVQDGDNTLEITQASMTGLELEAKYEKEG